MDKEKICGLILALATFDTATPGGAPPPSATESFYADLAPWTESEECKPQCDRLRAQGYGMIWPECRCNLFDPPPTVWVPTPVPPNTCDLTEVLLAAREVEPFLPPQPPHLFINATGPEAAAEMRAEADRLDSEDAAIARLRRALAACEPGQPERHDDGDQKNPVQLDPPRKNQQKPVRP